MHKALLLLKRIPKGKVTTYKALADACGTSPRAIGTVMRSNKNPVECPCYKVIRSDGSIGGYSGEGGIKVKIKLLKRDGVAIIKGRIDRAYVHAFD
ncbi:MAG: MGMT family protein [Candidatus Aenigmarchaeota archaeon]|nr:MGMT family protein [Candidatus Aenigmarchaeota archaeon]